MTNNLNKMLEKYEKNISKKAEESVLKKNISELEKNISELEKRIREIENTNINGMFKRLKRAEDKVSRVKRKLRM